MQRHAKLGGNLSAINPLRDAAAGGTADFRNRDFGPAIKGFLRLRENYFTEIHEFC